LNSYQASPVSCIVSLICFGFIVYGILGILHREIYVVNFRKEILTYDGHKAVTAGRIIVIIGLVLLILNLFVFK
jgi:hypothetical protein